MDKEEERVTQCRRAQQPAAMEQRPRSSARPVPTGADGGCGSARRNITKKNSTKRNVAAGAAGAGMARLEIGNDDGGKHAARSRLAGLCGCGPRSAASLQRTQAYSKYKDRPCVVPCAVGKWSMLWTFWRHSRPSVSLLSLAMASAAGRSGGRAGLGPGGLPRRGASLSIAFRGSGLSGSGGRRKANDQQIAADCRSGRLPCAFGSTTIPGFRNPK